MSKQKSQTQSTLDPIDTARILHAVRGDMQFPRFRFQFNTDKDTGDITLLCVRCGTLYTIRPTPPEADSIPEEEQSGTLADPTVEELDSEIAKLKDENQRIAAEADRKINEISSRNTALEKGLTKLRSELTDVQATLGHVRAENTRMQAIDVRSAVQAMLEYIAGVNNTVIDSDSLDSAREMISFRTERLIGLLSGCGMTVESHGRGTKLEDGRADISGIPTDEPALDMTVQRTNRFGCRFRDEVYPAIPEDVVVLEFNNKKTEEADL